ncbi:unnamed protein product [Pylaiella littoralis]
MKMALGSSEVVAPIALGAFFLLASYLNLNDPDWLLWSTAYALGAAVCLWSALQGASAAAEGVSGKTKDDASRTRRSAAMAYGAACLGLAGHSAFLAPQVEPASESSDDGMIIAFLSSEVAREAGGALIMSLAMAMCGFVWRPRDTTATASSTTGGAVVGVVSVAVAGASIVLGMFLPGYLQRAGIAVPAHCGGE